MGTYVFVMLWQQLYSFGETVSVPFWSETWKPESFVDRIEQNLSHGLHTLCLLGEKLIREVPEWISADAFGKFNSPYTDIKVKELSMEELMR